MGKPHGMLRAVRHGELCLRLQRRRHRAVALHAPVTQFVSLEQLGRERAAAVVALTTLAVDANANGRHSLLLGQVVLYNEAMKARSILITGAGSGFGRATALMLAAQGARLMLGDVNLPAAEETSHHVRKQGGESRAQQLDV